MFDQVAELYDLARPGYPPELFDDLVDLAGLRARSRVLEIGCGTDQATIPLAVRGLDVVCVELGEALAVVGTQHVLPPGGDTFFVDVQGDYDAVAPDPENRPPAPPEAVGDLSREFAAGGRFGEVAVRRYVWDVAYTAGEYIDVLDTYSGHRAMDPETRERLYERIRSRIESRPAGRVRKSYLALMHVAQRR